MTRNQQKLIGTVRAMSENKPDMWTTRCWSQQDVAHLLAFYFGPKGRQGRCDFINACHPANPAPDASNRP